MYVHNSKTQFIINIQNYWLKYQTHRACETRTFNTQLGHVKLAVTVMHLNMLDTQSTQHRGHLLNTQQNKTHVRKIATHWVHITQKPRSIKTNCCTGHVQHNDNDIARACMNMPVTRLRLAQE